MVRAETQEEASPKSNAVLNLILIQTFDGVSRSKVCYVAHSERALQ